MLRILVVPALVVGVMVAVKDGRALEHVGLVGSCVAVAAPPESEYAWQACRGGRLEGRPDLTRNACVSTGIVRSLEYWRCPTTLASDRSG